MAKNTLKKLTPIIVVERIEPCLPFWTERIGFTVTVTVPHEDTIGFAILEKDGIEIMHQSRASVDADLGASGAPKDLGGRMTAGTTTLFIEVDSLDDVIRRLGDTEVVVPRRKTFYGMDEIFVRPPCGTIVGFAAKVEE